MGIPVLIIGESGSGKSTSMRNFQPNEIGVFNVSSKPLPFKSKIKCVNTDDYIKIENGIIGAKQTKTFVIDDAQYLMAVSYTHLDVYKRQAPGLDLVDYYLKMLLRALLLAFRL